MPSFLLKVFNELCRYKILILFILYFLIGKICFSQDTTKILFIGNSFTYNYDLPGLFDSLAKSAGYPVVIAQHTPGGMSVGDTVQGTSAHMNNPLVYDLIRSNDWDYLLLQDNQGRFVRDYGIFPGSSLVIEGHIRIRDSLLFYHPCAHMLWFAGFGPKNGFPPYSNTGTGLIDRIYNNYRYLLDTAGQVIAPFGPAWQRIIASYPGINLWDTDDTHPGLPGTYLNACVLFATIFKHSPANVPYSPNIGMAEDSILKETAWQTTLDSILTTGLKQITPEIVHNNNYVWVPGFNSCKWYCNDSLIHNGVGLWITQDGKYFALAEDENGCSFRTMTYSISAVSGFIEMSQFSSDICLFPNPAKKFVTIQHNSNILKMSVYNTTGQCVFEGANPGSGSLIHCEAWPAGLYIFSFTLNNYQTLNKKLTINR